MCNPTHIHPENLNDLQARFSDETVCKQYLAQLRWNGSPVCPHCGNNKKIYNIVTGFKCGNPECYKKFSVLKGTIFEESKIPLRVWFVGIYIITAHKKGYASHQLARDLDVTQKTAWFMLQRIRFFMAEKTFEAPLKGIVEVDETYVGGAEKNKHADKKTAGTQGRSIKTKAPVFGMVERGGRVIAMTVTSTTAKTLQPIITKHVAIGASIMTDEFRAYMNLHRQYQHGVVRHGEGQYKSGQAHTNTMEGYWSLLKRSIFGIYHSVSVKHLDRYVSESSYRYNTRKVKDGARFEHSLTRVAGRLTYKELIAQD